MINHEAWSMNMITFIRERGLEDEFKDWSGGFPYPVAAGMRPDIATLISKYGEAERALDRNRNAERPTFQEKLDARDAARTALEAAISPLAYGEPS